MKNCIIIIVLILLPLMLLGNVSKFMDICKKIPLNNGKFVDRTWRLNEVIGEYYSDITWETQSKEEYVYNDVFPTRVDTVKTFYYDIVESAWVLSSKGAYTYDVSGVYCTQVTYIITMFGFEWPFMRINFDYDTQHRLNMMTIEGYAGFDKDWTLSSWMKFFYNPSSVNYIMSYTVGEDEDPASWEKITNTNDISGRPIISISQTSTDSTNWVNSNRSEVTYHQNDTSTGQGYINALASMFMYFGSSNPANTGMFGMVTEMTDQYYDNGWVNEYKTNYTYNNQNLLIELIEKYWDAGWVNDYQTLYTYGDNNLLHQTTENYWMGPDEWYPSARYTYNWGSTTGSNDQYLPPMGDFHISAYPNPFVNELSINLKSQENKAAQVAIYNAKGQLVKKIETNTNVKTVWDGKDKDNRSVSNGIYFIKASSNHQTLTKKVMLVK